MRKALVVFSVPFFFGVVRAGDPPAGDEAILAAIDKGREAAKAGKGQEAIEHLQKAIGMIQAKTMKGLASFLPSRDAAQWEMGEVDSQTGNWGSGEQSFQWSQVQRRYTKKGADGPEVSVMITNSPQFIEPQRAVFEACKDPATRAMMNQADTSQKIDVVEEDGWLGLVTTRTESCSITALGAKVMVQIEVQPGDEKLAKEFWAAIDRKGLAAASK
jgi:hypothetical protein